MPSADMGSLPARDVALPAPSRRAYEGLAEGRDFDRGNRKDWLAIPVVSSLMVWAFDGSAAWATIWLALTLAFGQIVLPFLSRLVRRLNATDSLYCGVLCGWALGPGPVVGILMGVLLPWVYDGPVSSFTGGLIGLALGSLVAAMEGVILVFSICTCYRIATGRPLL